MEADFDALISELHRRGELSELDMRILRELQTRPGCTIDISINLCSYPYVILERLGYLKSLGLVDETKDALGSSMWQLSSVWREKTHASA
ncbi:MAG: hypothetical protein N3G75_06355 [Methanothrix sp.]|nr:hypothetical protein [Methanothrix sp.]MCX8207437.1 hypothetical protein [Methanothrix sp.]